MNGHKSDIEATYLTAGDMLLGLLLVAFVLAVVLGA